jgi:hypothetical protein
MGEQFLASIACGSRRPATVEVEALDSDDYAVFGTLADQDVNPDDWPEPPHVAFANVNLDDPMAAITFTETYGTLYSGWTLGTGTSPSEGEFRIAKCDLQAAQTVLREAWRGSPSDIVSLEGAVEEGIEANVLVHAASVELSTNGLSPFIDFLFLRDLAGDKIGVCLNPDCLAPYFVRRRKTQKFCDSKACAAFAARKYAKRWWDDRGSRLRKKSRRKQRRRRK